MTMTGKWGGQKKLDTFVMLHIHQDINYDSYQTSVIATSRKRLND